jgi:two-component system, NarL family, nitrate/nitrite response regulator NarL
VTDALIDPQEVPWPEAPGSRLAVLVLAAYPSVRHGLVSMLHDFDDIDARAHSGAGGQAAAATPDVVVQFLPASASAAEALDPFDSVQPVVLVSEVPPIDLPGPGTRPIAILPAETDAQSLHAAIVAVSLGMSTIDTRMAANAGIEWRQPPAPISDLFDHLTAREIEVLELVARGLPNKSIGRELGISEHTVKFHVGSILTKLGAESRTEAVTIATRLGVVPI